MHLQTISVLVSNVERVENRDVDHQHLAVDHADRNSIPACFEPLRVDPREFQVDQHGVQLVTHHFADPA